MKLIQDRCSLRDMAESMAGDGNDEMGHLVFCYRLPNSAYVPFYIAQLTVSRSIFR